MNNLIDANSAPSYKWRRRLILLASLLILLIVLTALVEVFGIIRAQVIINNAASAAARVTITGEYDTKMFPNLDAAWTPQDGLDHDGIPCPASPDDPAQVVFESHWGMPCDPTSDDDQWLRKDILRLVTINAAARNASNGLILYNEQPDIPGTGVGAQTYSEIVHKAQTESGWFHVWLCSEREFVGTRDISSRYSVDLNHTENGFTFPRCVVAESQPGPNNAYGKDQYDGGDPYCKPVTLEVFYNYPLITPLGWLFSRDGQYPGFIQLTASKNFTDECFGPGKVINLSNTKLAVTPTVSLTTP